MLAILLKGFTIGLSIAAPVGPIGLLCIRRTLVRGSLSGLLSGLGAATADTCYGAIAGFGLSFVTTWLLRERILLSLTGGMFLCFLGIKTLRANALPKLPADREGDLLADYVSTVGLTITNPMTILSFVAIFAGVGIAPGHYADAAILVFGVLLGSAIWWILLTTVVGILGKKVSKPTICWVDRISGGILLVFGMMALSKVV